MAEPGFAESYGIPMVMSPNPEIHCIICGALVGEHQQSDHRLWHERQDALLDQLRVALFQKSLREIEADLS